MHICILFLYICDMQSYDANGWKLLFCRLCAERKSIYGVHSVSIDESPYRSWTLYWTVITEREKYYFISGIRIKEKMWEYACNMALNQL